MPKSRGVHVGGRPPPQFHSRGAAGAVIVVELDGEPDLGAEAAHRAHFRPGNPQLIDAPALVHGDSQVVDGRISEQVAGLAAAAVLLWPQQGVLAAAAARGRQTRCSRRRLRNRPAGRGESGRCQGSSCRLRGRPSHPCFPLPWRVVDVVADLDSQVEIPVVPHQVSRRAEVVRRPGVVLSLGGDLAAADQRDRASSAPVVEPPVDRRRSGPWASAA